MFYKRRAPRVKAEVQSPPSNPEMRNTAVGICTIILYLCFVSCLVFGQSAFKPEALANTENKTASRNRYERGVPIGSKLSIGQFSCRPRCQSVISRAPFARFPCRYARRNVRMFAICVSRIHAAQSNEQILFRMLYSRDSTIANTTSAPRTAPTARNLECVLKPAPSVRANARANASTRASSDSRAVLGSG
ncbi:hypothetical protein BC936DRAFT_146943 [Jimgerdemannia flammicorona]|uniref:Uncharacterized protein n=1 Tax=Jimgerdemannia flammicorona TaxID=994334 RepID=A0A433DLN7_9FUNG|nr:hypothetical protein BC936DRAFT_146943 [Jimgerdemannia flammicorona]